MNWSKARKVFLTVCSLLHAVVPAKRKRQIISSLLILLVLGSCERAQTQDQDQTQTQTPTVHPTQTGDWQAVQNLRPGTRISVRAQHHILCVFQAATDDELVCKPVRLLRLGPADSRFDRQNVREVRLEHNQAKDMWIGAGMGTGAGAIVGASSGTGSRSFNALVGGLSGALLGTVAGGVVSVFRRGELIYKR